MACRPRCGAGGKRSPNRYCQTSTIAEPRECPAWEFVGIDAVELTPGRVPAISRDPGAVSAEPGDDSQTPGGTWQHPSVRSRVRWRSNSETSLADHDGRHTFRPGGRGRPSPFLSPQTGPTLTNYRLCATAANPLRRRPASTRGRSSGPGSTLGSEKLGMWCISPGSVPTDRVPAR